FWHCKYICNTSFSNDCETMRFHSLQANLHFSTNFGASVATKEYHNDRVGFKLLFLCYWNVEGDFMLFSFLCNEKRNQILLVDQLQFTSNFMVTLPIFNNFQVLDYHASI